MALKVTIDVICDFCEQEFRATKPLITPALWEAKQKGWIYWPEEMNDWRFKCVDCRIAFKKHVLKDVVEAEEDAQ